MQVNLPTPPPPPPPPPSFKEEQLGKAAKQVVNISPVADKDKNYFAAVQRWLAATSNKNARVHGYWRNLSPVLQEGPQCGLVCLSMASSLLPKENSGMYVSVPYIFETAKTKGYTNLGEMFSAENMALLAFEVLKTPAKAVEGLLNKPAVIAAILRSDRLILVPYDADFNHEPCCKKGFRAHWAILHGFAFIASDSSTGNPEIGQTDDPRIWKYNSSITSQDLDIGVGTEMSVFARQGKSLHLGCWSLTQLRESNQNLVFVDTKRDPHDYVLPTEGIAQSLCNWSVVLG